MTTPNPRSINITVGALAPPLSEQLLATAIPESHIEILQGDLRAADRLSIRGYIPAAGLRKTREKVIKQIQALFRQHGWKSEEDILKAEAELAFRKKVLADMAAEAASTQEGAP